MTEFDPKQYQDWTPQAQQRALERLREMQNEQWRPFYCGRPSCDGKQHDAWQWPHARKDQRPPTDDDYLAWLICAGRGAGKTKSGSEYTHRIVRKLPRIIILAPTSADLRDVIVDGDSGIMTTSPPGFRPHFEPSKRRLTWPNGATALLLSAEEPERLRGPQAYWAWLDEAAIYPKIDEVWSNLLLGLRLGQKPRVLITTTPKPRPWMKERLADPRTRVFRASTYDNLDNLAPTFAEEVVKRFEGTRIGRQELHAELLTDVEGALWTWEMIEASRMKEPPEGYDRVVVGVDPAGTAKKRSDETGIVVAGIAGEEVFILADLSGRYSPNRWANLVKHAYEEYEADAVVPEVNYGADMVTHTLRSSGFTDRIIPVVASRGKAIRAEPVVSLFEQSRAHIVGHLPTLEDEMASWVPGEGASPNRVDAMVWAATALLGRRAKAQIASPTHLRLVGA